jgi:hypothetical protein
MQTSREKVLVPFPEAYQSPTGKVWTRKKMPRMYLGPSWDRAAWCVSERRVYLDLAPLPTPSVPAGEEVRLPELDYSDATRRMMAEKFTARHAPKDAEGLLAFGVNHVEAQMIRESQLLDALRANAALRVEMEKARHLFILEALQAIVDERLSNYESPDNEGDEGYRNAINHCELAITQLGSARTQPEHESGKEQK